MFNNGLCTLIVCCYPRKPIEHCETKATALSLCVVVLHKYQINKIYKIYKTKFTIKLFICHLCSPIAKPTHDDHDRYSILYKCWSTIPIVLCSHYGHRAPYNTIKYCDNFGQKTFTTIDKTVNIGIPFSQTFHVVI